jgi:hypothetical protein
MLITDDSIQLTIYKKSFLHREKSFFTLTGEGFIYWRWPKNLLPHHWEQCFL